MHSQGYFQCLLVCGYLFVYKNKKMSLIFRVASATYFCCLMCRSPRNITVVILNLGGRVIRVHNHQYPQVQKFHCSAISCFPVHIYGLFSVHICAVTFLFVLRSQAVYRGLLNPRLCHLPPTPGMYLFLMIFPAPSLDVTITLTFMIVIFLFSYIILPPMYSSLSKIVQFYLF